MLEPVGTAPGLVVPPRGRRRARRWSCCPGPPRELQPMWEAARADRGVRAPRSPARPTYRREIVRLFGIPESEIANTLRAAEAAGIDARAARDHHLPAARARSRSPPATSRPRSRHTTRSSSSSPSATPTRCSRATARRSTSRSAALLGRPHDRRRRVVHGRAAGRPADRPRRLLGLLRRRRRRLLERGQGRDLVGVDPALIERVGAVSTEVAEALAEGALERFDADIGVGITGIAGPGGGTEEKPVGLVCFSVAADRASGRPTSTRSARLPGGRADIRDRSTTVAMHLLRRLLLGEADAPEPARAAGARPPHRERRARAAVRRARAARRRCAPRCMAGRREPSAAWRAAAGGGGIAPRDAVLPRLAPGRRGR